MKAIIYAGIGLFSVATVYGIADYYNTQKKGILDNLYKEEEMPKAVEKNPVNTSTLPVNVIATNATNTNVVTKATKKIKKTRRTIRLEDFSRGRIPEPIQVEPVQPVERVKEEPKKTEDPKIVDPVTTGSSISTVIKKEPVRKFSLDLFSRAPLRNPIKKDKQVSSVKIN